MPSVFCPLQINPVQSDCLVKLKRGQLSFKDARGNVGNIAKS